MPSKFPKPFYRTARKAWFLQVGGRQIKRKLGPAAVTRLLDENLCDDAVVADPGSRWDTVPRRKFRGGWETTHGVAWVHAACPGARSRCARSC